MSFAQAVMDEVHNPHYTDSDHMFCSANDEDYDITQVSLL